MFEYVLGSDLGLGVHKKFKCKLLCSTAKRIFMGNLIHQKCEDANALNRWKR